MQLPQPLPVAELAGMIGARVLGDAAALVYGLNEIHKVRPGDLTFVDVEKYYAKSLGSAASFVLIDKEVPCPEGKVLLVHEQPFQAYNFLAKHYRPFAPLSAQISPEAEIHPSAIIEPGVVVGPDVRIGEGSHIQANVCLTGHVSIGRHVSIQPGCVIGSDAFYYKKYPSHFEKWRSIGRVIIEDHVEIGALCTINSGVSGDTIIGEGTKFDCQVHIGHGAVIGKMCLFAAQVGIGGKTIIGDRVVLYGQVGVAQSLEIGAGAVVLAQSGVSKSLEGGKTYFGSPAAEARQRQKELAALRQLPEFLKRH